MATLPNGTVTLLFSDVEGSTRLVSQLGNDYERVLDQHRTIVRDAVSAARGVEVDQRGDEFFVVFPEAEDAATAAVAIQRGLAEHPWPEDADVRVRIGMHTGTPSARPEGGYFGLDVHRAA